MHIRVVVEYLARERVGLRIYILKVFFFCKCLYVRFNGGDVRIPGGGGTIVALLTTNGCQ